LFRWDGRIRGGQFIVGSLGAALLSTLASMMLLFAFVPVDPILGGWPDDVKFWSVWTLGQLPGWVATSSLTARRLHDLGKSAIWLIPIFAYVAALQLALFIWPGIDGTWVALVLISPILMVGLWLFSAAGENHDNRFGAMPAKG